MIAGHPLDPFADVFGPSFFGGGVGQVVSAEGYASAWGSPRLVAFGQKGGAGDFDGLDDGLLLAFGEKGGQAQGKAFAAPWVIASGQKAGSAEGRAGGHGYLLVFGEKSITASLGYGLTYGHARALGQGVKAVGSWANGIDVSYDLAHGAKSAAGRIVTIEAGELIVRSQKEGAGFSFDHDQPYTLGHELKGALGYGLTRGGPWLEVFGVKVGGTTTGEGFGRTIAPSWLIALGQHGGEGYGLADSDARALVAALKIGAGYGVAADAAFLLLEGLHGGQALNADSAFNLSHGRKAGSGSGYVAGLVRTFANGNRLIIIFPPHIVDEFPRVWVVDE